MCQYSVFYGEYENEKKTGQKKMTFPNGNLNQGFLNNTVNDHRTIIGQFIGKSFVIFVYRYL